MKQWYRIEAKDDGTADISLYDEIGMWGVTAKDFTEALQGVKDRKAINLYVNSPGGDVFEGMAIYNALLGVKDRLTAHVMGLAASMASVILMAAPVRIIHQGAMVMVHNPSGSAFGQADELRKTADTLDQIKGQMAAIYAAATGKDDGTVRKLMDDETWMGADEAVTQGFATEKDEEQVAASLRRAVAGRFRHVPPEIAIEETPTIRDAENALRDAGFPADRAKAILAVGFARDGQSGHRDDAEAAVIAALEDMNVRVEAW